MRECTPALFNQVVDAEQTARVCAEIEDALERVKRGEMSREDFETFKAEQKKRLAIFTPHATFPNGRRVSEDAVASGLSMYDVDYISPLQTSPRRGGLYQRLVEHTLAKEPFTDEGVKAELRRLGICLVHVTPSTEGFRLFFAVPEGMSLEEAQRWMSEQLGDAEYDGCVKDLARCSFAVPREYILYLDEEELFKERMTATGGVLKSPTRSIGIANPDEQGANPDEQGANPDKRLNPDERNETNQSPLPLGGEGGGFFSRASPTRTSSASGGFAQAANLRRANAT